MKKVKKLLSMLMASMITAGTMSTVSAGAWYYGSDFDSIDNDLNNFFVIPKSETELFGQSYMTNRSPNGTYYISKTDCNMTLLISETESSSLNFWVSADTDVEKIKKIITEIYPEAIVYKGNRNDEKWIEICARGYEDKLAFEEARNKYISLDDTKKIYNEVSEITEIKRFNYYNKSIEAIPCTHYLTAYYDLTMDGVREEIDAYLAGNHRDWYINHDYDPMNSHYFSVVPKEEASPLEHYNIANEIYKLTEMIPLSASNNFEIGYGSGDVSVDLHNNIKGDANDDGELNLADAVMIMQSVYNPKYATFTHQGKYNADVTGDYDGITNKDALTIQRQLLGLN